MNPQRFATALHNLSSAIAEVEALLGEMRANHDPPASYIYSARVSYRSMHDRKSGKRHAAAARSTWLRARELGFSGDLRDWERLLGA